MQNDAAVSSRSRHYADLTAQDGKISHILSFVSGAQRYAFPALFAFSEKDIESIWSNVSNFIERQMLCQKGVHIAGLGTFTFSVQKIDIGRKHKLIKRPIFILAEKLRHSSDLKQIKASPTGEVPVVPLNFSTLSVDSPFERDVVERIVRESLMLIARVVASQPALLLSFHSIGLLSFRQGWVRMKFYKDFLVALDSTWSLVWDQSGNSREGVSSFVVSDRTRSKSSPGSEHELITLQPSHSSLDAREQHSSFSNKEEKEDKEGKKADNTTCQLNRRETLKPATVNGLCLTEDLEVPPHVLNRLQEDGDSEVKEVKEANSCEDSHMGQELCYLCKERAQKNVSAEHLSEERRREEKEEERLVMVNQLQLEQELLHRDQAFQETTRRWNEREAACDPEMAEGKERETQRHSKCCGSYIFRTRPVTPTQLPRQRQYQQDLLEQAQDHQRHQALDWQTENLMDRMGQMELADEIVEESQQQLQKKASAVRNYKRALDRQCDGSCRGLQSTTWSQVEGSLSRQSCSEGLAFGQYDDLPTAVMEQRQRARELHQHQINTATLRRRDMQFSRILEQKREIDMLNRTRQEMRVDHMTRHNKLCGMRVALEDLWAHSVKAKRLRDQDERTFRKAGSHLLIDQFKQPHHYHQCRRRRSFCGGTNLWKESRYITGSRLMV
ncbi:coiled-coil domain-containing protein 81-like isoform X1 [Clupea harengus]|uniref:Coiled-coil domain-containing protein 81-like isoform X1 n=1 Tax=Clupea harengus TaxID=7950 RepID=A0A8M1KRE2_CLUHA|nr:coiled-coil domain-containing protein 81-like isoform X1 [Clupea harengus]